MDHGHHSKSRHDPYGGVSVETGGGSDRLLQWSVQETRDLLLIRAELDPAFMDTKRNKLLWEMVSTRMTEMGYTRSPDQCKCKWKNLVTRYKGCETMDTERMRQQFPYYNEMQTIFEARMQRMLWLESEGGAAGSSQKGVGQFSSGDDELGNEDGLNEIEKGGGARKKRKAKAVVGEGRMSSNNNVSFNAVEFREMMEGYMRQQMEMEMQWMKVYEEREKRRREREMEWRRRMELLENERISMERRWREREQERRIREDERAEKRDALVTTLLNKLRRDNNNM